MYYRLFKNISPTQSMVLINPQIEKQTDTKIRDQSMVMIQVSILASIGVARKGWMRKPDVT